MANCRVKEENVNKMTDTNEMTTKDLKKLNRTQLLEIMLKQSERIDELEKQLEKKEEELSNRQLMLNDAGSIAEASLMLNSVFADAQAAASMYLENVKALADKQELELKRIEDESKKQADELLRATKEKCEQSEKEAKIQAEKYWNDVSVRLKNYLDEHAGLQEMLQMKL